MDDPFIRAYIEDLLKNIRTQVLLKVITPYTRISIAFIAKELNIGAPEVEQLLVALILDKQVDGQIDQIGQLLLLRQTPADAKKQPKTHHTPSTTKGSNNDAPPDRPQAPQGPSAAFTTKARDGESITRVADHQGRPRVD